MQKDDLDIYIKLASELDFDGDIKTADEIDKMIREAQTRDTLRNLFRGTGDFIRDLRTRGRNRPPRAPFGEESDERALLREMERAQGRVENVDPSSRRYNQNLADAMRIQAEGGSLSGAGNPRIRTRGGIIGSIVNALRPTARQLGTYAQQFPDDIKKIESEMENLIKAKQAELKAAGKKASKRDAVTALGGSDALREQVAEAQSRIYRIMKAHEKLIEEAIAVARRGAPRGASETELLQRVAATGILGENSNTTEAMVLRYLRRDKFNFKSYSNEFGPIKQSMSPLLAALITGGVIGGGSVIKDIVTPGKVVPVPVPGDDVPTFLTNEPEQRSRQRWVRNPVSRIQKWLDAQKASGKYVPGTTTKEELYNLAFYDKSYGEEFANDMIQYVGRTKGLLGGTEKTAPIAK